MSQQNASEVMVELLKRYIPQRGDFQLSPESSLEDLGIDSARRIDILLDTEDHFRISIEEQRFDKVRTVADLIGLVQSMTATAA